MKKAEVIFGLVFFIVILILIHFFKISEDVYMELSLAGTIASLLGLILVLVQISRLKTIAETSEQAAQQTKDQLMSFLSAIDIGKVIKIVQETQGYNRRKKYELSIVRMQEIKETLIYFKNHPKYTGIISIKHFSQLISNTSVDINSIEKSAINPTDSSDPVYLNRNLDIILTALNDLQSKVKLSGV